MAFQDTIAGKFAIEIGDRTGINDLSDGIKQGNLDLVSAGLNRLRGGPRPYLDSNPIRDAIVEANSSYSGTDCIPIAQINDKLVMLGNVATFSYSIFREKGPVRTLGRSYAKGYTAGCIHKDEPILTSTGLKKVEDISIGDNILAYDEKTKQTVFSKCINKIYSGIKQTFKVKLSDGTEMSLTKDHRVLTDNGWKTVGTLQEEDQLLIPINYNIDIPKSTLPLYYLKLLAYGIGDGIFGLYKNGKETRFSLTPGITDIKQIEEIETILKENNLRYSKNLKNNCYNITIKNTHKTTWFQKRNYVDFITWTKSLNIYGKYSHNKIIPSEILNLSNSELAVFLSRLFSTDSSITKHSENTYRITYVSTSKVLVDQIKLLLTRFGIHSYIKNIGIRDSKLIKGKHEAFTLTISGNYVYKFLDKVGIFGKTSSINMAALEGTLLYDIDDIKRFKKLFKISSKSEPWCNGRKYKRLNSMGYSYQYLKDNGVLPIVYKDNSKFISIDTINESDLTDTYDLEIENTHNFFGPFLSHNSRTIAGSIVFIVFDRNPLYEILSALNYEEGAPNDRYSTPVADQIPPIDLILWFSNEYGHKSILRLYGVEFMQEGQTHSINDLYTENVMQYVAKDIDVLLNYKDIESFRNLLYERQISGQFTDNHLASMLEYQKKIQQQIADVDKKIFDIQQERGKRGLVTFGISELLPFANKDLKREYEKQLEIKGYLVLELEKINKAILYHQNNVYGWNPGTKAEATMGYDNLKAGNIVTGGTLQPDSAEIKQEEDYASAVAAYNAYKRSRGEV